MFQKSTFIKKKETDKDIFGSLNSWLPFKNTFTHITPVKEEIK